MSRIIITDDEQMNLRMTEFILKKYGYETTKTLSGAECLNALASGGDLVLLDVMMPELNGFETYELIRKNGYDVPVVFLTAAEDTQTLHHAEELGVPSLRKPFKPDELLGVVRSILK